jgi:tellurite resistance protein TerC
MTFPFWTWLVFAGLVLALLFLDLFVLHRRAREIPFRQAVWMTAFWIGISLAFGGFIWAIAGAETATRYLTAYLVEKSLSLDNVFVFAVIFSGFSVPKQYRYHVLFYGVLGAIVFRGVFVVAGAALLSAFAWLVFVFGAFLVFTGLRMLRGTEEQADPQDNRALRLFRRVLPATEDYQGDNFIVRRDGKRYATPLLAVLVVIESSDVIFAVDSVPAVLSITQTTFVAYSSIVFAVLGLRALYFALEGLVDRFVYLHYGLAAILVFLGAKFMLEGFDVTVSIPISLAVIVTVITLSIAASLIVTRGGSSGERHGQRSGDGAWRQESGRHGASSPSGTDGEAPASDAKTEPVSG